MHYYIDYYDKDGNLINTGAFCSSRCQNDTCDYLDGTTKDHEMVTLPILRETDYDEYCGSCGAFIHHGLNCEHSDKARPGPAVYASCAYWRELDREYETPARSSLHHDNRCKWCKKEDRA